MLDPSLRCFGWAVFKGPDIVGCGVIETAKDHDDEQYESLIKRAREISYEIKTILKRFPIKAIYTEHMIGSKSAVALRALSICLGIVSAIAVLKGIHTRYVHPADVKTALTGDSKATKDDMVRKALEMYPNEMSSLTTKAKKEAIADVIGVYFAALRGLYITGK